MLGYVSLLSGLMVTLWLQCPPLGGTRPMNTNISGLGTRINKRTFQATIGR